MKRLHLLLALSFAFAAPTTLVGCDKDDDSSDDDDDDDDGDDDDDDDDSGDNDDNDSGDNDSGDNDDSDSGDNDSGDSEDGMSCNGPSDCPNVVCDCNSGPVNVKNCDQGVCLGEEVCDSVCEAWDEEDSGDESGGSTGW